MKHYAVIGSGPMGLMTAITLLDQGHRVDVYERDDRLGGMSASFDFDGLGIELDAAANAGPGRSARDIAAPGSRVRVLVVPTDEELEIARQAADLVSR